MNANNKFVLITGASSGLGFELAKLLLKMDMMLRCRGQATEYLNLQSL